MTDVQHDTAAGPTELPSASPLLRQINDGNWLAPDEAEALRAELYFQRAVQPT